MSSELSINRETIQRIVSELSESIDLLSLRQRDLVKVGGQAFGASPGGTTAHRAANRAHEALVETIDLLRAAQTDFTESLNVLTAKIEQTDEQSKADTAKLRGRVEQLTPAGPAGADGGRSTAGQETSS